MQYSVNIDFKKSSKCPSFAAILQADNESIAKKFAIEYAKKSGFNGVIKTVFVIEVNKSNVN